MGKLKPFLNTSKEPVSKSIPLLTQHRLAYLSVFSIVVVGFLLSSIAFLVIQSH
ncbi:MAG: hypothetical protein ABGX83_10315 [Nitrospira sp.]